MDERTLAIEAIDGVGLAEFHVRALHDVCEALRERHGDGYEHIWQMLETESCSALQELGKSKGSLKGLLEATAPQAR